MSTANASRSPCSSPMGRGHHQRINTPLVTNNSITTPSAQIRASRPAVSRHTSRQPAERHDASPNYFNLAVDASKSGASSGAGAHARNNWSPPSSRIRSTAAASPRIIPVDQNPDFAEFKRQSDLRGSQSGFNFNISSSFASQGGDVQPSRPTSVKVTSPTTKTVPGALETYLHEEKPRSPKRTLSSPYTNITDRPRRNSPAGFTDREALAAPQAVQFLRDDEIRLSLPPAIHNAPLAALHSRAETLPTNGRKEGMDSTDGPPFAPPSHIVTLLEASNEEVLLLDLRVSTQYSRSKIRGALNLCIPTTLLKRASYNTQKLAETFNRSADQKKKFERWRSCKYIVVYDASASKAKDAQACVNMLKKFATEGWSGTSYVIRGGFYDFARQFPLFVQTDSSSSSNESPASLLTLPSNNLAPVIGGCPMPMTKSAANPFFGNIRQNMDLIGGVGQIAMKRPINMTAVQLEEIPQWLRLASDERNDGKLASDKFLAIEKMEQKRMQQALSGQVHYGTPGTPGTRNVQLAGIEKGSKNRYNNIWPYEHSRVKIEGLPAGACDYINANHIKATWSNKRYIATQGPIPSTFNDFWKAVWQQDVRVILMLTAEMESGQVKAHNYWSQKHFGPLHLTFLSEHRASLEPSKIHHHTERPSAGRRRSTNPVFGKTPPQLPQEVDPDSEQPFVMVRRFTLSNDLEPFARMREVTQLQYSNWPDFGAPAHPAHLLGLVEQCDAVVRRTTAASPATPAEDDVRPMLVHCSAGCGRTGTFCTVDSVIDMMKRQRTHRKQSKPVSLDRQYTPMEIDKSLSSVFSSHELTDNSSSGSITPMSGNGEQDWVVRDDIDLVEKAVEDFRLQRLSMVQSLRQYVLCYETVLEWLAEQTPRSA
ncbi:hypothetical protein BT63DRAFT_417315 [Microthyrium microscopicum]|uniref:protein-tyrosine-phosphatase n=1 Tax=Microthyrium microscopicum TaxID=703497 RepID=A0A6A6U2B2_9PEZI|nr:hypothetical protein BT63DRAFT_417315 [Microthyrium microscopicum]